MTRARPGRSSTKVCAGQARGAARQHVAEIGIEKGLNARVGGTQTAAQQLIFLIVVAQQRPGDFEEIRVRAAGIRRLAERGQLQIDVADKLFVVKIGRSRSGARVAGCSSGRRNVTFERVVHHHAVRIETPAERANGALHAFDPTTRQAVAIALVVERNHFLAQHLDISLRHRVHRARPCRSGCGRCRSRNH